MTTTCGLTTLTTWVRFALECSIGHLHFVALDTNDTVLVEYVWIGGSGEDLRSKTRSFPAGKHPKTFSDCPEWNFDGSSTGQAPGNDSEILLRPVAMYRDPFRRDPHKLVLCECYKVDGTPAPANSRAAAVPVFEAVKDHHPWFGMEQEYSIVNKHKRPLGFPSQGSPAPQGPYYCGNGLGKAFGRSFVEAHYKACLYAGIQVSGINAEVMPGQWEYQVGPVEGIAMGDQLWIARFIMLRMGEFFQVDVSLDPKIISGDWNGAGCHCNFSTKEMREKGGLRTIISCVEKLKVRHKTHIAQYGKGNERRLTGAHETASIDVFTYGVADRGASVRIPRETDKNGCGYAEDRRPASNVDPYVVTTLLMETMILDKKDE